MIYTAKITEAGWLLAILTGFFINACTPVIVPDISNDQVDILTPVDSFVTSDPRINFFWEYLQDAETYKIRIVSPSFSNIQTVVLDTVLEDNKASIRLPYGAYEWYITASNSAYTSACCDYRRLYIKNDSSSDLSTQTLNLQSPLPGYATSNTNILFQWAPLSKASYYWLQLGNSDFSQKFLELTTTTPLISQAIVQDGVYYVRVRAINEATLTMTPWSYSNFTLDRIAPLAPFPLYPDNGDTIKVTQQSPDLDWDSDTDRLRDTIFIYDDAQRTSLIFKSATSFSDMDLDQTTIGLPSPAPRDFFWEVLTVDQAGNKSNRSPLQRFWVR